MRTQEQDLRLTLLNTLLTTPHRDLARIYPTHQAILEQDPRFYVQLAAWYADEGEVRDHKEMFVVNLVLSTFPGHRDVGLALLRQMPPYQVGRIFDFIKGRVLRRRHKQGETIEIVEEKRGLFRNPPRSLKTEITRYLREREADAGWFDSLVLQARRATKRLYASLHIKPAPRAQAILFEDNPPPDSRLFAIKRIAQATNPAEQARAIVAYRIPYRVAVSLIKQLTPTVLVALIEQMTPQETINNLGSLKRHGAFENEAVKALIEGKLEAAQQDGRVSAYKAKTAAKAAGVSEEIGAQLDAVTEAQVKAKGRIERDTVLLIDKSGSMAEAIEIGKQLGAMVAGVCEARLFVYAFDTLGYPIEVAGPSLAAWEKAFEGIHAGGGTSCGVALEMMRRAGQRVEQLVMITDEGENTDPYFVPALQVYQQALGADPHVIFIKTRGASDQLEQSCRAARIPFDAYQFDGDYYALPNLLPLLSRPSRLELLLDIMAYPLPERRVA